MSDYEGYEAALAALTKNKVHHDVKSGELSREEQEKYIRGYAMICAFLSDEKAFKKALERVSLKLWLAYNADKSHSNKFTRAISVVGARHGFCVRRHTYPTIENSSPMQFKLIDGDPQLGFFLRNKLFWKDSMDRRHGEHSHSLQWLAISAGSIGAPVAITDLYARSGEFVMKTKGNGKCRVWAWLADSFPSPQGGGDTQLAVTGDDLVTKSFRSPQIIMNYLLDRSNAGGLDKHFVASYLQAKDKGQLQPNTNAPIWKQSPSSPNRYIKQDFSDRDKTSKRSASKYGKDGKKDYTERVFHSVRGHLYV